MRDVPTPEVSIIVPTLREAANVPTLARRIDAAMGERAYELIVVDDDSRDGIDDVCAALAGEGLPIRLIIRRDPLAGLSGAVLRGIAEARGAIFVVMDADLQHPPERIPTLLEAINQGAVFALGSRYIEGGGVAESWSLFRRLNSRIATLLARPFAGTIRDPMSGFFALPRHVFERGRYIAPTGYKIALELLCKCRANPVREVPILFGLREHGRSKLSIKEQLRYLEHLSRLYDFSFPRAVPAMKFLTTVAIALATMIATFAFAIRAGVAPDWPLVAGGYAAGSCVTALFHARYVRTERSYLIRKRPWRDFILCTICEIAAVSLTAAYLTWRVSALTSLELVGISFAAGTIVRYLLRKELILDVRGLRYIPSYAQRLDPREKLTRSVRDETLVE